MTHPPALDPVAPRPPDPERPARVAEIADVARRVVEVEGADALTMRRLADELGIKAPSLYKHVDGKEAVERVLVADALFEMGDIGHAAVAEPGRAGPVAALLRAYRVWGLAHPNLYRLLGGDSVRSLSADLPEGLVAWSGEPFWRATGEPYLSQALWAFAHGTLMLEIDDRFLEGSDLDRTWRAGADAFTAARNDAARNDAARNDAARNDAARELAPPPPLS